jgi:hypothetical protein
MTTILIPTALLLAAVLGRAADPSDIPIRRADGQYDERYRLRIDLNGDARLDLILSQGMSEMGNSGGTASSLSRTGGWPVVAIEPTKIGARIWGYGHISAQSGVIGSC